MFMSFWGSPTTGTPTQVQYEAGRTYTLAWAPKNHVAAECTNAFIPDNFLRVYMQPYNGATDPTQEEFKQNQVRQLTMNGVFFAPKTLLYVRAKHVILWVLYPL